MSSLLQRGIEKIDKNTRNIFFRLFSIKIFWKKLKTVDSYCKLFDNRDLKPLWGWTQRMMSYDSQLFKRLAEKRLKGLRCWEYGLLLSFIKKQEESKAWKVLDVGPGNSTFPCFFKQFVGELTTIDYENPLEPSTSESALKFQETGIKSLKGNMLFLKDSSETYNLVTCISVIEHLDDQGDGKQLPYEKFQEATQKGLKEMMRVIKKGGYFYLTTDVYLPDLQSVDYWSKKRPPHNIIWSAYKFDDIQLTFIKTLQDGNFKLVGKSDLERDSLLNNKNRKSFRGQYFSTFAILAQKT